MPTALLDLPLKTIDQRDASLGAYAGKVILVVNVASKCGLTPQYEGLEALYRTYKDRGLVVTGFPANDFAGQEPGSDADIAAFCQTNFSVDFPMFSKIAVTGANKHPLYAALTKLAPPVQGDAEGFRARLRGYGMTPNPEPEVLWNFETFLIGRNGEVVARFSPDTAPDDAALIAAIEDQLIA